MSNSNAAESTATTNGLVGISQKSRQIHDERSPSTLEVFRDDDAQEFYFLRSDTNLEHRPVPYQEMKQIFEVLAWMEMKWDNERESKDRFFEGAFGNNVIAEFDLGNRTEEFDDLRVKNSEVYELYHALGYHVSAIANRTAIADQAKGWLQDNDGRVSANVRAMLTGKYDQAILERAPMRTKDSGIGAEM